MMEKLSKNEKKISFVEAVTNNNKIRNLKKDFTKGCDGAHPLYKKGYAPLQPKPLSIERTTLPVLGELLWV